MTHLDPTLRLREVPWQALCGLEPLAILAIEKVLAGERAERVLDRLLRDHRGLEREQRTALVEAVFGVALWRRRLAHEAKVAASPEHAGALLSALVKGLSSDSDLELGVRWSFPDWIAATLVSYLGEGAADSLCAALNLPGPICLRANALRITRDELASRLRDEGVATRPAPYSRLGLLVEGARPNILALAAHREGLFEVQDEGSQLLGLLVEARPGHVVLDYCAGAGGKTLLLAGEAGELHVHDSDGGRLARLEQRAARAGVKLIQVHRRPPPPSLLCDRVLVDAPCSELGALRGGPDARFHLSQQQAGELPALQSRLLRSAAQHVLPGGRLVYATCTLRREENEAVVESFLRDQPAFSLRSAGAGWLPEELRRGPYFLSLPDRHGTDGFFAAVLET